MLTPEQAYELQRARGRRYYLKHREQKLLYQKWYRQKNCERIRVARLEARHKNPRPHNERGLRWALKHPRQQKNQRLKRSFGIDLAAYERLLLEQHGVCAICERPERAMRNGKVLMLAVDHSHETGKVRGLLCGKCNRLIGGLSLVNIRAAVSYLEKL